MVRRTLPRKLCGGHTVSIKTNFFYAGFSWDQHVVVQFAGAGEHFGRRRHRCADASRDPDRSRWRSSLH